MTKKKVVRFVRNFLISSVVLLVILVGAGVAYTWFMGRQTPAAVIPIDDKKPTPVIKRVDPAPNAPEGVSVQSLTSPIEPGMNASIIIKTNPGSWCTISVVYDKTASSDSGLGGKTADDRGSLSWTWTVENTVPLGKWPVTVTCLRNKFSAVVIGELVIARLATH